MKTIQALSPSKRIVQICLIILAIHAIVTGYWRLGFADTDMHYFFDSRYRFMSGVYLGTGLLTLWVAFTIRRHSSLVYFLVMIVFFGGIGQIISNIRIGAPEISPLWLMESAYALILPVVAGFAQYVSERKK